MPRFPPPDAISPLSPAMPAGLRLATLPAFQLPPRLPCTFIRHAPGPHASPLSPDTAAWFVRTYADSPDARRWIERNIQTALMSHCRRCRCAQPSPRHAATSDAQSPLRAPSPPIADFHDAAEPPRR